MGLNIIEKLKEKNLKEKLKHQDQAAFEELYNNNIDDIYRFIYFKTGKKDDSADLSSLAFLKTWEYIKKNKIGKKETLRALVYKITRNVIIDHYRSKKPDSVSLDDENNKIDIADERHDIEVDFDIKDDYEKMMLKVMELKNEYREVLVLRFVNELTLDEISDITGKKKINVRVILHRAIKALKEMLKNDED
jgi:RNA polymerase sigma-70 factor, ECF subfamily